MKTLPSRSQLEIYLRADEEDRMRPDWDAPGGILEICEEPVAQSYHALGFWRTSQQDNSPIPTLEEVIGNAMATDFLIFASDEDKAEILGWVCVTYGIMN